MAGASEGSSAGARQFYLQTRPEPTFATVHLPAPGRRSSVGVLLCPPFGWSEQCTHRTRRTWANRLAGAGHPALRIDLPGTGDSAGSLSSPLMLEAWVSAVRTASSWLRDEFGCSRVCGLGIGVGGILAWLAAAEGAPLDDLILWGVPARARQLVRELEVAAQVDVNSQVETRSEDVLASTPPELEEGGLLDEAGQVISRQTLESLSAVDLRAVPLPDPERRRALIFRRAGVKADAVLEAHLRTLNVDVAVRDGESYAGMMCYVQESVVPGEAISESIDWLSGSEDAAIGTGAHGIRSVGGGRAAESLELLQDGVAIRERPVLISLPAGEAAAIITEPLGATAADLSVLFLSGGSDRRIGANRMWVDAARSWAALGVTSVRVDAPGIGDSDGDERAWDALSSHYDPSLVTRLKELLDALEARDLPGRFLVVGHCAGAYRSIRTALVDARIVGICAIGLSFFNWTWWTVNIRDSWLAVRRQRPEDSKLKWGLIQLLQRCLNIARTGYRAGVIVGQFFPSRGERFIRQLTGRGTELDLILRGSSYAYEQLTIPGRHARVRGLRGLHIKKIPGEDSRFRPVVSQRFIRKALDDGLLRLLPARAGTTVTEGSQTGALDAPEQLQRERDAA